MALEAYLCNRWPGPTLRGPGQLVLLIAGSSSRCFRVTVEELLVCSHHSASHCSAIQVQLEGPIACFVFVHVYPDASQAMAVSLLTSYTDIQGDLVPAAEAFAVLVVITGYVDPDWV